MKKLFSLFCLLVMVGCSSSNGGSSNAGVSSSQSSALSSLYNLKGQSSAGSSSFSSQSIGTASGGGCDFYTIENFDSTSATSQDTISCAQSIDVSGLKMIVLKTSHQR